MDPLTQQLMQRAMGPQGGPQGGAPPQGGQPAMPDLATLLQPPQGATAPMPTMPGINGQPPPAPPPQAGGNGLPVTPPNPHTHIPGQNQRFDNAQQLMDSYRNGWQPNPMLLRASQTQG